MRRALFLVIDNWALRDAISDLRGTGPGGWFVTGTPYAKSDSVLLSTPGLRPPTDEDIAEARQLMADAGYPNGEGFPKPESTEGRDGRGEQRKGVREDRRDESGLELSRVDGRLAVRSAGAFGIGT